jgi:hypothetical protein
MLTRTPSPMSCPSAGSANSKLVGQDLAGDQLTVGGRPVGENCSGTDITTGDPVRDAIQAGGLAQLLQFADAVPWPSPRLQLRGDGAVEHHQPRHRSGSAASTPGRRQRVWR